MSFHLFLRVLRDYRYMILLTCVSAVGTAIGLTYILSEKYCSSTCVMVRPQKAVDLVPKRNEVLDFPVSYFTPIETALKTYAEIIQGRAVAERVVGALGMSALEGPEGGAGWRHGLRQLARYGKRALAKTFLLMKYGRIREEDPLDAAVERVRRSLSVKPTRDTYLFELEAKASSPELAAGIANTTARVAIDYIREVALQADLIALERAKQDVAFSRQQLDQAREAMLRFQDEEGVVSISEEMKLHLETFFGLTKERELLATDMAGAVAEKTQLEQELSRFEVFQRASEKVVRNPVTQELELELAQKEVALAGMRERYAPEHRDVRALETEIAKIKNTLATSASTLSSEVVTSVSPVYLELDTQRAELVAKLESLRARRAELDLTIQGIRTTMDRLPEHEQQLASLKLAIDLQEQKYMVLSKELEELNTKAHRTGPEFSQTDPAVAPLYPSEPIKMYHAALAGVLSLVMAIGLVLLREHLNLTVTSEREVSRLLQLRVLAVVPRLAHLRSQEWPLICPVEPESSNSRRRHSRVYVHPAIHVRSRNDDESVSGRVVNISRGGACLLLDSWRPFTVGDRLTIGLDLLVRPQADLTLDGTVVRASGPSDPPQANTIAMQFGDLTEASLHKLAPLLEGRDNGVPAMLPDSFTKAVGILRTEIFLAGREGAQAFLVTSSSVGEGKSVLAANVALSLAGLNRTVALIDANLRTPALHHIFATPNERGLSDVLAAGSPPVLWKAASGVSILPAGHAVNDPSALFERGDMRGLIQTMKDSFDVVLVDTPAISCGSDAIILASMVDRILMVLGAGIANLGDAKRAKELLARVPTQIVGVAVNNHDLRPDGAVSDTLPYAESP